MMKIYETHLYRIDDLDLRAEAEEFFESGQLTGKSIRVSRLLNGVYQDAFSQRFTVPDGVLAEVPRLCEAAVSQYLKFSFKDAVNQESILDVYELLLLDADKVWRVDLYEVEHF